MSRSVEKQFWTSPPPPRQIHGCAPIMIYVNLVLVLIVFVFSVFELLFVSNHQIKIRTYGFQWNDFHLGYCSIYSITIDDVVFVVDAGKVKEKVMYVAVVVSNSK